MVRIRSGFVVLAVGMGIGCAWGQEAVPGWTLLFGGDVMLNGISPKRNPFGPIAQSVIGEDLAFANLEIPLTDATTRTTRKTPADLARRAQFILKASPGHAVHFKTSGWDMVSLGNNHAMDYGERGLRQMLGLLDRNGIAHAGAGLDRPRAMAVAVRKAPDGTRIGMVSALAFMGEQALWKNTPATPTSPGIGTLPFGGSINPRTRARLRQWIQGAKRHCDFLVVSLHWGIEKQTVPSPYQVALGRAAIEEGADIVWGHHPHVLQGAELYRGKPIFYSLGNLVAPRGRDTGLVRVFYRDRAFVAFRFLPASYAGGQVRWLAGRAAAAQARRFESLSRQIGRRYPSSETKPLF